MVAVATLHCSTMSSFPPHGSFRGTRIGTAAIDCSNLEAFPGMTHGTWVALQGSATALGFYAATPQAASCCSILLLSQTATWTLRWCGTLSYRALS